MGESPDGLKVRDTGSMVDIVDRRGPDTGFVADLNISLDPGEAEYVRDRLDEFLEGEAGE